MGFLAGLFSGGQGAGFQAQGYDKFNELNATQNTDQALAAQNQFNQQLAGQNGIQNQSDVYNQLAGIANGNQNNPLTAQFNQNTSNAINEAKGTIASTKGINPEIAARVASQNAANSLQNAAGQNAQQRLSALQNAGSLATQQVGQQQSGLNSQNNYAQGQQANIINSVNNANSTNAEIAKGNQQQQGGILQGVAGAAGSLLGFADGGEVPKSGAVAQPGSTSSPKSKLFGSYTDPTKPSAGQKPLGYNTGYDAGMAVGKGIQSLFGPPSLTGGPTQQLPASNPAPTPVAAAPDTMMAAKGGNVGSMLKAGGHVPGQARVKGDSYANDIVDAKLSPGEIVIPRHITQSPDAAKKAAAFVAAILAKQGKSGKGGKK